MDGQKSDEQKTLHCSLCAHLHWIGQTSCIKPGCDPPPSVYWAGYSWLTVTKQPPSHRCTLICHEIMLTQSPHSSCIMIEFCRWSLG